MIKKVESIQNPEEPHVLTKKEASKLLMICSDYLSPASIGLVDGKHRTESVAKKMESDGQFDLADTIMGVHDAIRRFTNGDNRALSYFNEVPMDEIVRNEIKNTVYEKSVESAISATDKICKTLDLRDIDWEKSAEVIAKVKKERFPEMLTMVEKLSNWQRDQSPKGHSER